MKVFKLPIWVRTTEMNNNLIQVQDLNSFYGASHILRNINFEVKRGETIGLMGRNGMGKSTLLKSIMGIVTPQSGHVYIKGMRMNDRVHKVKTIGPASVCSKPSHA